MTTNHAEIARDLLDHADSTMNKERAEEFTASAHARATLALAEEQRTANLLAAVSLLNRADITKPWDGPQDTPEWAAIRDQIATRLGLN